MPRWSQSESDLHSGTEEERRAHVVRALSEWSHSVIARWERLPNDGYRLWVNANGPYLDFNLEEVEIYISGFAHGLAQARRRND